MSAFERRMVFGGKGGGSVGLMTADYNFHSMQCDHDCHHHLMLFSQVKRDCTCRTAPDNQTSESVMFVF